MRQNIIALTSILILAALSISASASLNWWEQAGDIDWAKVAKEVSHLKLGEQQMSEFITYEEALFEERMCWVNVDTFHLTFAGKPVGVAVTDEGNHHPEFYYDFWQRGDVAMTAELAKALQVKASRLPHWTELSRTERLQLFATFVSPEDALPAPPVHAPLHLALAGQMGPTGVAEVRELPQLLGLTFGDEESTHTLRYDRYMHHDWEQRFVKRYMRFITNQETGGFFEPWHEEFSPGNAYVRRITNEKALAAVEKAYREADRELLLERIRLHPVSTAMPGRQRRQGYPPPVIGPETDRFVLFVNGAITTGELRKWCAFYYFRVYGESRTIAEGVVLTTNSQTLARQSLVIHVRTADGNPCPEAYVTLENTTYGYRWMRKCRDEGIARTSVPCYVYPEVSFSVTYDEEIYPNIKPIFRAPAQDGTVEIELTLE